MWIFPQEEKVEEMVAIMNKFDYIWEAGRQFSHTVFYRPQLSNSLKSTRKDVKSITKRSQNYKDSAAKKNGPSYFSSNWKPQHFLNL